MTTYTPEQLRQIDAQVAQVMGLDIPSREYAMAELGYRAIESTSPAYGDWRLRGVGTIQNPPSGNTLRQPEGHSDWNMRYGLWVAESFPDVVTEEMVAGYRLPAAHYATDIADAWRCIDYMRERGWLFSLDEYFGLPKRWIARFIAATVEGSDADAEDPDVKVAICLAFLAANGVEVAG